MKIKNYMLVVKDLEKSKDFYWKVLGLRTLADMGIHAVLTGGLALQTEGSFKEFTGKEISYHGNDTEIYFCLLYTSLVSFSIQKNGKHSIIK